jgi:polyribonucleotide nucleotidyltransferase
MELMEAVGKTKKREYSHETNDEELRKDMQAKLYDKVYSAAKTIRTKHDRHEAINKIKDDYLESIGEEAAEEKGFLVNRYFHDIEKQAVRRLILDEKMRVDGRKTDEIRPIWSEIDYLPSAHGSALFTRGETQSLTTVTLGNKMDEKMIDEVLVQGSEKFVLHYNFPPFSTGEAKPSRGLSRREVGHGNLAHRALKRMVPMDIPYAIRIVSDILESNGSSSMATVCAGTLALMDAGVQIKKPVSGIAMGLITDGKDGKFAVLSDILGDEDHLGDMDFKVTGTSDGITATQMDIKVDGLSYEILAQALDQAKKGRLHILGKILETIPQPRSDYKPHAPRIVSIDIPKDMIGAVIGPGGKVIQEIQRETNTTVVIEEIDNHGEVQIFATDKQSIDAALKRIQGIIAVPEIGQIYAGTVKSIVTFGAFVEVLPGKEGLLHISELDWKRVNAVEDVLKVGDVVEVKLIEFDKKANKLKLSRKALLPRPPQEKREPEQEGNNS